MLCSNVPISVHIKIHTHQRSHQTYKIWWQTYYSNKIWFSISISISSGDYTIFLSAVMLRVRTLSYCENYNFTPKLCVNNTVHRTRYGNTDSWPICSANDWIILSAKSMSPKKNTRLKSNKQWQWTARFSVLFTCTCSFDLKQVSAFPNVFFTVYLWNYYIIVAKKKNQNCLLRTSWWKPQ